MMQMNQRARRFWVVSPNVRNKYQTVRLWSEASLSNKAAFMGYRPDDKGHKQIGYKFAHVICPNDIVLIARRHDNQPQIVGFGVVVGSFKKGLAGFKPPQSFGSLRTLSPFKPLTTAPPNLNIIRALNQIAALHELHPERRQSDKKLCNWMERQLEGRKDPLGHSRDARQQQEMTGIKLRELSQYDELEFQIRTKKEVRLGKQREAILLHDYEEWLLKKGRKLQVAKYKYLHCDAYEEERNNLIEAKSVSSREYIRMAVGQLFDYAYLGRKLFVAPHKAILLPDKPKPQSIEWLTNLKISVVWKERKVFLDNANGQFS
jgi:hypothetical protein